MSRGVQLAACYDSNNFVERGGILQPIIGITLNTRAEFIDFYVKAVAAAKGCPVLIGPVDDVNSLNPILKQLDGIIFSGGSDINPVYYQQTPKYGLGEIKPHRDEFEMKLLNSCLENFSFPIFGICRGFQLLNVYFGGSLYQSLEKEKSDGIMHTAYKSYPIYYPAHSVTIETDSFLQKILGKDSLQVNSLHHQAIDNLASNLKATSVADDGIIEGIEALTARLIFGVQWHPEMMAEKCSDSQKIFQGFINSCSH